MKPRLLLIAMTLLAALVLAGSLTPAKPTGQPESGHAATEQGIDVCFSPYGGCTEAVVVEIEQARKSIRLQAYSFTSADIAKAAEEHNAEHLLVLHDKPGLMAAYQKNFAAHPAYAQRNGGADGPEC